MEAATRRLADATLLLLLLLLLVPRQHTTLSYGPLLVVLQAPPAAAAVAATTDAPATHHPVLWTAFDAPGVIVWYGLDLGAYRDVILLSLGSSHGSSSPLFWLLHKS